MSCSASNRRQASARHIRTCTTLECEFLQKPDERPRWLGKEIALLLLALYLVRNTSELEVSLRGDESDYPGASERPDFADFSPPRMKGRFRWFSRY